MTFKELRTKYEINGLLFDDQLLFPQLFYNSMAEREAIGSVEFDHDDWLCKSSGYQNKSYFDRRSHKFVLCQPTGQTVASLNNPIYETDAAISSLPLYDAVKELVVSFKPAEGEKQKIEATQKEFVEKQGRFFFEELKARYNKLGENSKSQGIEFLDSVLDGESSLIDAGLNKWLSWDENRKPFYAGLRLRRDVLVANAPTLDKIRELYNSDAHEKTCFYSWVQPQILDEEYYDTAETLLCGILMFKEWLKDKETNDSFLDELIIACQKLQSNITFKRKPQENNDLENSRNRFIRDFLRPEGCEVKDQTQQGESPTGKQSGEIDILITKNNSPKYIIEALNLSGLNTSYLQNHVRKLEDKYDKWGLREKYILVYADLKNGTFDTFVQKYKLYIQSECQFKFARNGDIKEVENENTAIRIFKTTHDRDGKVVFLYHLLVLMRFY